MVMKREVKMRKGKGLTTQGRDQYKKREQTYQEWRDTQFQDLEFKAIYEEVVAERGLWLQLVEARKSAGITQAELANRIGVSQAQVARIEKRGYDDYNLNTLRRYAQAVGKKLEVALV